MLIVIMTVRAVLFSNVVAAGELTPLGKSQGIRELMRRSQKGQEEGEP